ncbi:MAG: rRNA maturation RNase YbeY [Parcubacteria group bacterium]|nr:rRNA maturation RNase YbeY [Parcubacteria group bacterium]
MTVRTHDIEIVNETRVALPDAYIRRVAAGTLRALRLAGSLGVIFVEKRKMKRFNRIYQGKNRVTDVLAFPYADMRTSGVRSRMRSGGLSRHVGDVILCPAYIREQARTYRHPLKKEYAFLLIHGILHCAGYDHTRSDAGSRRMFAQQDALYTAFADV